MIGSGRGVDDHGSITVSSGQLDLGVRAANRLHAHPSTVARSPSTIDSGATLSVPSGPPQRDRRRDPQFGRCAQRHRLGHGQRIAGARSEHDLPHPTWNRNTIELGSDVTVLQPTCRRRSRTDLDATSPGTFGQLVVGNSVSLADLSLELNPSYTPGCGTAVTALTAPSISGTWDGVSGPTPSKAPGTHHHL